MELEYTDDGWASVGGEVRFLRSDEENLDQISCRFNTTVRSHMLINNKVYSHRSRLSGVSLQVWDKETFIVWRKGGE